jgi:hypothetical protein
LTRCTRAKRGVLIAARCSASHVENRSRGLSRGARDSLQPNHCALDSLVFDPRDHRAVLISAPLWKKFLTWVKPTQRRRLQRRLRSRNEIFRASENSQSCCSYA